MPVLECFGHSRRSAVHSENLWWSLATRPSGRKPWSIAWPAGWNRRAAAVRRNADLPAYRRMSRVENPYRNGFASRRIGAQPVADESGAFRRFARSWLRARLKHERNPPNGSGIYRYPNTADANEATAVQIAAHSPSDNASTTVKAARLVSRSVAPCGDAPNCFGSSQKFRRSAERVASNPVLTPIVSTFDSGP